LGGSYQTDLVHAIIAADDECMLGSKSDQHLCHCRCEPAIKNTHELMAGMTGVYQRTKEVEGGRDAKGSSNRRNRSHRWMEAGCQRETKTSSLDHTCDIIGPKVDVDAKLL
jgi:hypothetical protein